MTVFLHSLLLLTILPLDCYLTPTRLFSLRCQLTLSLLSDLPLLIHFQSHGRSRAQALCLGFAPKQTKRLSVWCSHARSVTLLVISEMQKAKSMILTLVDIYIFYYDNFYTMRASHIYVMVNLSSPSTRVILLPINWLDLS